MNMSKECGLPIYESLDDMLNAGIIEMYEYDGYYYVKPEFTDYYDGSAYKVNIKSGETTLINYTSILLIKDKAIPIDPETLKKAS